MLSLKLADLVLTKLENRHTALTNILDDDGWDFENPTDDYNYFILSQEKKEITNKIIELTAYVS